MPDPRYGVERLEDKEPDEMYGNCRMAAIEALIAMTGSAGGSRDEVVEAVAGEFPAETRESGRTGSRAGFEPRDAATREQDAGASG